MENKQAGAEFKFLVKHGPLPVTVSKNVFSAEVTRLPSGAKIEVIEVAEEPVRGEVRARIAFPAGWISTKMADGSVEFVVKEQRIIAKAQVDSARPEPVKKSGSQSSGDPSSVLKIQSLWRRKQASRHVELIRMIHHEVREHAVEEGALSQTGDMVDNQRWRAVRDSVCGRILEATKTCTKSRDFVSCLQHSARNKKRIRELRLKFMVAHKFAQVAREKAAERASIDDLWKDLMPFDEADSGDDTADPLDIAANKNKCSRKNKRRTTRCLAAQRQAAAAARHVLRLNSNAENSNGGLSTRDKSTNESLVGPSRTCQDKNAERADNAIAKSHVVASPMDHGQSLLLPESVNETSNHYSDLSLPTQDKSKASSDMSSMLAQEQLGPTAKIMRRRTPQDRECSSADQGVAQDLVYKGPIEEMGRRLEERSAQPNDAEDIGSTRSQSFIAQAVVPRLQNMPNKEASHRVPPVQNKLNMEAMLRGERDAGNVLSWGPVASTEPISARSQPSNNGHHELNPSLGSASGSRTSRGIPPQRQQRATPPNSLSLAASVMLGTASDSSQTRVRDNESTAIAWQSSMAQPSGSALFVSSPAARAPSENHASARTARANSLGSGSALCVTSQAARAPSENHASTRTARANSLCVTSQVARAPSENYASTRTARANALGFKPPRSTRSGSLGS